VAWGRSKSAEKMSLELLIGPMFAGKTSALMARVRRYNAIGYNCFLITHSSDNRYGHDAVINHNKEKLSAFSAERLLPLLESAAYKSAKIVAIEEAHFFDDLVAFVIHAVETDGKQVICVGLNGSAERKPIGHINELVPFCDIITKIDAFCVHCTEPTVAPFTRRLCASDSSKKFVVGSTDIYEAVCRRHFHHPN
jgi:thymidine kinase